MLDSFKITKLKELRLYVFYQLDANFITSTISTLVMNNILIMVARIRCHNPFLFLFLKFTFLSF